MTSGSAARLAPLSPARQPGLSSGERLRMLRRERGLTLRQVAGATRRIASREGNDEFAVSPGRLSEIETKGVVPSIHRLYSLSVIYNVSYREILSWFGVPATP